MKYLIPLFLVLTACGSAPEAPKATTVITGGQVVISVYNAGTQDAAFGTPYMVGQNVQVTIPSIVLRTEGSTDQNGLAVGIDLGNGLGQCYYNGNTASQNVFTWSACTNGLTAGQSVSLVQGQIITLWSYNHVNSNDSVVELVLQGSL